MCTHLLIFHVDVTCNTNTSDVCEINFTYLLTYKFNKVPHIVNAIHIILTDDIKIPAAESHDITPGYADFTGFPIRL